VAVVARNGSLEVATLPSGRVVVSYTGTSEHSLESVRTAFEGLYGKDRFVRMLSRAQVSGSPKTCWCAVLEKDEFEQALTGN
jgi:hypothetical protein